MNILRDKIKNKKTPVIIFFCAILVMFITYLITQAVVMNIEIKDFRSSIKRDTRENLLAAKNMLDGMVQDLEITADELLKYDDLKSQKAKDALKFSHEMNFFDATFVSDMNGNSYDSTGYKFNISNQSYFLQAKESGEVVFSEVMPSKRFGAIQIIAFPLISDENEEKGILFGLFSVKTFSHVINAVLDNENNIYIVDSNGTYINCFDENHEEMDHGNFWDVAAQKLQNKSIEQLKKEFVEGDEGDFVFADKEADANRYCYHMPLGVKDWQIVLTIQESVVNSHIESIRQVDSIDLIMDGICLTIMMICIYLYFKSANDEIIEVNQEISKNDEMLRMAVENTNHIIFEYDIENKIIDIKTQITDLPLESNIMSHVPESILSSGIVVDSSEEAVRRLFETIVNEQSSNEEIQIINNNGERIWYRVQMYNLYNEKGKITGTVGCAENINMLKKGEIAIKRRNEMYSSFLANAMLYARVNLNTDTITELNGKELQISYHVYLKNTVNKYVCDEYRAYVENALSLDALSQDYQLGKEYIEIQCLTKSPQGPQWVACLVYRIHKSNTAKVTILVKNIDEKKRQEIALKEQAERDGLTGLYNAVTTRTKINYALNS